MGYDSKGWRGHALQWKRCSGTWIINSLTPRRNRRHFADDIFKCIFLNENVWTPIKFSLKFVPKGPINNISALFQIMAWRRPGDKPLSEPTIVSLPTHIWVTRPQLVNTTSELYSTFCTIAPLDVRSGSYIKQMPREHLSYIEQMPLELLLYIKETSWNTSVRTKNRTEFNHGDYKVDEW